MWMTKQRKNRLIGAGVFTLIVALLMLMLFHNSNPVVENNIKMTSIVPPEPEKPAIRLSLPNQHVSNEEDMIKMTPAEILAANRAAAGKTPEISLMVLNLHQATHVVDPVLLENNSSAVASQNNSSEVASQNNSSEVASQNNSSEVASQNNSSEVAEVASASVLKDAELVKASADQSELTPSKVESTTPVNAIQQMDNKNNAKQIIPPKAWVIQCGMFDDANNASMLVLKLKQNGYETFSKQETINGVTATSVYVGPEIDQSRLTVLLTHLKQQFNVDGIVKRYDV